MELYSPTNILAINTEMMILHRVRKKEATSFLGITLTNLNSFVIFGTNHPDTSLY